MPSRTVTQEEESSSNSPRDLNINQESFTSESHLKPQVFTKLKSNVYMGQVTKLFDHMIHKPLTIEKFYQTWPEHW